MLAACCGAQTRFTNCSAAFLDNKMVVDDYSPTGKCSLPDTATGELTVCTADLSPQGSHPVDQIKFKVAIRDQQTGTLTMFSNETFKRVDIRNILSRCRKGDHIVLITMVDEYALPHNEILVK
ncbi:MAG: hypothetical protein IT260_22725 [Saprospiraceae bacterium]|nr:hypothetical protein [Saprospiraceae bacterium]